MTDAEVEVSVDEIDSETKTHAPGFFSHWAGRAGRKLKRIRKLLPQRAKQRLEAPVNKLLSLVCTLGNLSFRAYNDPNVEGYTEVTPTGNRIKHVNYGYLNDSVEGVLKIFLQRARNVIDADLIAGYSDPYVVFSTGWSQVASRTIDNEKNPVWNSTHYLLIRKPGVVKRDDDHLNIRLYDSDTYYGDNAERSFRQFIIRDDYLGGASVDLADLKKPGVHKREVKLSMHGDTRKIGTTVTFTAEFIPFEDACAELGKPEESEVWNQKVEDGHTCGWSQLPVDQRVGHIFFQPVSFINCMRTGTQVWIHANSEEKAVVVAFRGTEANRLKDLITDLSIMPTRLRWRQECDLTMNENVQHKKIRVHSGFRAAYESIWSSVMTIVENITHWSPEWTICVTGHSLGGAIATLCAFEFANRRDAAGNTPYVMMMNFGAPRLGNREFVRAYGRTVPESYRVVNKLDIIHKIPFFLKHVQREISFEEDGDVIVDKRQSIRLEAMESPTETDEEEAEHPDKPKKLTRRGLFKAPGFEGHFENYYFNVVMRAVASLYQDQKETLHELIRGYHDEISKPRGSTKSEARAGQSLQGGTAEIIATSTQNPNNSDSAVY